MACHTPLNAHFWVDYGFDEISDFHETENVKENKNNDLIRRDYYPGINLGLPPTDRLKWQKNVLEKYGMPYTVERRFLSR